MFTSQEIHDHFADETAAREPVWLVQAIVMARVRAMAVERSREQVARRLVIHGRSRAYALSRLAFPEPMTRACPSCGTPAGSRCIRLPVSRARPDRLAGREMVRVHAERAGLPACGYLSV